MLLQANFQAAISARWRSHAINGGRVAVTNSGTRLSIGPTAPGTYSNAQIDDYSGLPRAGYPWLPPLKLRVRARFSHPADQLHGTAGFGFWNDPFAMTGQRTVSLPKAAWFFFNSCASNMQLAHGVPGWGWKAATIDAWRLPFFLLAPTTPLAMLLLRSRWFYNRLWPLGQRAIGVHERILPVAMTEWHTYQLVWESQRVTFAVDDAIVLQTSSAPRGPLGLVLWMDNQGMMVTPTSLPRHILTTPDATQWLELDWLQIET